MDLRTDRLKVLVRPVGAELLRWRVGADRGGR
jgi:hypothetical protein